MIGFDASSCRRCARLVLPQGGRNANFGLTLRAAWVPLKGKRVF